MAPNPTDADFIRNNTFIFDPLGKSTDRVLGTEAVRQRIKQAQLIPLVGCSSMGQTLLWVVYTSIYYTHIHIYED
jgi:hypothetical protein